jgi:hypothetical protein
MGVMPKWAVSLRYPTNVSVIYIGLSRVGSKDCFEIVERLELSRLEDGQIQAAFDAALSRVACKCDELNRKIDLANRRICVFEGVSDKSPEESENL